MVRTTPEREAHRWRCNAPGLRPPRRQTAPQQRATTGSSAHLPPLAGAHALCSDPDCLSRPTTQHLGSTGRRRFASWSHVRVLRVLQLDSRASRPGAASRASSGLSRLSSPTGWRRGLRDPADTPPEPPLTPPLSGSGGAVPTGFLPENLFQLLCEGGRASLGLP